MFLLWIWNLCIFLFQILDRLISLFIFFVYCIEALGSTPTSGRAVQQKVEGRFNHGMNFFDWCHPQRWESTAFVGRSSCVKERPCSEHFHLFDSNLMWCNATQLPTSDVISRSETPEHAGDVSTQGLCLGSCCWLCFGIENCARAWAWSCLQANWSCFEKLRGQAFLSLTPLCCHSSTVFCCVEPGIWCALPAAGWKRLGQLCDGLHQFFCACRQQRATATQCSRTTWPHSFWSLTCTANVRGYTRWTFRFWWRILQRNIPGRLRWICLYHLFRLWQVTVLAATVNAPAARGSHMEVGQGQTLLSLFDMSDTLV